MLLVANLAIQNDVKTLKNTPKPCQMGSHLKILCESYPLNTNMTGFRWFSKIFASLCFGRKCSLSIGRVKMAYMILPISKVVYFSIVFLPGRVIADKQ